MLRLEGVSAGYGGLEILHEISLDVGAGEVVALIGANGAGKTTTLRTISGLLRPSAGSILFNNLQLDRMQPHEIVKAGLVQVPEGRELFGSLSVRDNLAMGAYVAAADERQESLREVYQLFPVLEERTAQIANTLSGGQQQMLAIGRALMARPKLLMLDEPSLGLAPNLVESMFGTIREIAARGITVLLVEQNAIHTLRMADHAYVLESGMVTMKGEGSALLEDPEVRSAYLGM